MWYNYKINTKEYKHYKFHSLLDNWNIKQIGIWWTIIGMTQHVMLHDYVSGGDKIVKIACVHKQVPYPS